MKTLKTCRLLYSKFYMHKKGKALEEKTVHNRHATSIIITTFSEKKVQEPLKPGIRPEIMNGAVDVVEPHLKGAVRAPGGWRQRPGLLLLQLQVGLPLDLILRVLLRHRSHQEVRVQRRDGRALLGSTVLLCHGWATRTGCENWARSTPAAAAVIKEPQSPNARVQSDM